MKYQELIERYIYAATRYMKKSEKEDVAKELQSIITDMLEERCGEEEPSEEIVKEVLNELGNPRDLYEKYSTDGKDCLIGAPYYGIYKYVMKTVLLCAAFGLLVAQMIGCIVNVPMGASAQDLVLFAVSILMETLGTIFGGVAVAFAVVTVGFAIMYHKEIKMDTLFDSLDQLPQLPKKKAVISKGEVAFGIGISVVFFTVFLACPEVLCMYDVETGTMVPIFASGYIHSTWYLIVMFGLLGIGRECMKLIDGTYTGKVLITTVVTDVVSAILSVIWLVNPAIINPDVKSALREVFTDAEPFLCNIMENFNCFFLACILFALIVDLVATAWKYYQAQK